VIAGEAGVAALLLTYPIYRSIAVFHCVATRAPAGEGQGLESCRLQAAFVLAVRSLFSTPIRKHECSLPLQPDRSWRAMRPVASIAIIVILFSIAAIGSLVTWAWVGAALRNWLAIGSRMGTFNVAMGMLLAATAMWLAML
jgi:hypothetical protein